MCSVCASMWFGDGLIPDRSGARQAGPALRRGPVLRGTTALQNTLQQVASCSSKISHTCFFARQKAAQNHAGAAAIVLEGTQKMIDQKQVGTRPACDGRHRTTGHSFLKSHIPCLRRPVERGGRARADARRGIQERGCETQRRANWYVCVCVRVCV